MTKTALLAGLLALVSMGTANAQTATQPAPAAPATAAAPAKQDHGDRGKFRAACAADLTKHCGDIKPIAGATPEQMKEQRSKIRVCLTSHKAQLSADCKAAVDEREASTAAKKKS